jgi:hypothetical protein
MFGAESVLFMPGSPCLVAEVEAETFVQQQ